MAGVGAQVELSDAYGSGAAAVRYDLEDPSSTAGELDVSVRGGRSPAGAGLPRLSLAVGVELQVPPPPPSAHTLFYTRQTGSLSYIPTSVELH